jgi:hypothetical protein
VLGGLISVHFCLFCAQQSAGSSGGRGWVPLNPCFVLYLLALFFHEVPGQNHTA